MFKIVKMNNSAYESLCIIICSLSDIDTMQQTKQRVTEHTSMLPISYCHYTAVRPLVADHFMTIATLS